MRHEVWWRSGHERLVALIGLILVACGGLYAYLMNQEEARLRATRSIRLPTPPPRPPRPWRWATEPEWVVHEVMRHLVSWAAFGRAEDPAATRISVRRTDHRAETPGTFDVELRTSGSSRTLTIRPPTHVWDPLAYLEVARELTGVGVGLTGGEPAARVEGLLLVADTASLRQADAALWAEMRRRPGDPRLHDTHDPRFVTSSPRPSRLENVEGLRAIRSDVPRRGRAAACVAPSACGGLGPVHGEDLLRARAYRASARAMAEVFPNGLQRKSLADFRRDLHNGGILLADGNLTEGLRRLGLRPSDFLVGVDGFAVQSQAQMDAVLTFTDEQQIVVIFLRKGSDFAEVAGPPFRMRFGPPSRARRNGA